MENYTDVPVPATITDKKDSPANVPLPPSPSPPAYNPGVKKQTDQAENRHRHSRPAQHFLSAYAHTWLGLSPLWLAGEALTPGTRVGSQFRRGRRKLIAAAAEVRAVVTDDAADVVVIVDEKLRATGHGKEIAARTAEVVKAAGENALLVVTSSLERLSTQLSTNGLSDPGKFKRSNTGNIPSKILSSAELKNIVHDHGRDALVLLDNALRHPVVVTGVSQFARTRGIAHADALLRLASLGLARLLRAFPESEARNTNSRGEGNRARADKESQHIEQIDAEELERSSSPEDRKEADAIGKAAEGTPTPQVKEEPPSKSNDPYETMRKRTECIVM